MTEDIYETVRGLVKEHDHELRRIVHEIVGDQMYGRLWHDLLPAYDDIRDGETWHCLEFDTQSVTDDTYEKIKAKVRDHETELSRTIERLKHSPYVDE